MSVSALSLLLLLVALTALLPPSLSFSLQTFSDAACLQALPYGYFNASLATNRTKACFPTYNPTPGAVSAVYVYCTANSSANADYVDIDVDSFVNDSQCDHKQQANVLWDVTSEYTQGSPNPPFVGVIPQGVCSAVQARAGADVQQWLANQTIYAIVRCDAVSKPGAEVEIQEEPHRTTLDQPRSSRTGQGHGWRPRWPQDSYASRESDVRG